MQRTNFVRLWIDSFYCIWVMFFYGLCRAWKKCVRWFNRNRINL